jgi:hypothetical protein
MNNKFFKYNIFLAISIGLSITWFLHEFEKNNNFLLVHEHEEYILFKDNINLQFSSSSNSHTNNLKKININR